MAILILAIVALGIVVALFTRRSKGEAEPVTPIPTECCGQHEVCERDSLLAAVSQDIEYYDDEELDRFRGRSEDDYTDDEADEFASIFYELRGDEVAGWVRSLNLRGVALPNAIKEEVLLLIRERRFH